MAHFRRSVRLRFSAAAFLCATAGALGWFHVAPAKPLEAASQDTVRISEPYFALRTPPFIAVGKRYAFTWPGGGPPQTYTIKALRPDGWVMVEVAEDNTNPAFTYPGELPKMWLHAGVALSIMEMRPLQ